MSKTVDEKVREGMRETMGRHHPDLIRDVVKQYDYVDPCRGDIRLGTACGKCIRCRAAHEQQLRDEAFDNLLMDDKKGRR